LDFVVASFSIGLGAIASVLFRQIRKQRIAKTYNNKNSPKQAYSFDTSKNSTKHTVLIHPKIALILR